MNYIKNKLISISIVVGSFLLMCIVIIIGTYLILQIKH